MTNYPYSSDDAADIEQILQQEKDYSDTTNRNEYLSTTKTESSGIKSIKSSTLTEKVNQSINLKEDLQDFRDSILVEDVDIPSISVIENQADFSNIPISDERLGLGAYSAPHDTIFIRDKDENTENHMHVIARHELAHKENMIHFSGEISGSLAQAYNEAKKILGEDIFEQTKENDFKDYHLMKLAEDHEKELREIKANYMMQEEIQNTEEAVDEIKRIVDDSNLDYISPGFDEAYAQFASLYSSSDIVEDDPTTISLSPDVLENPDARKEAIEHMREQDIKAYSEGADYLETILGAYDNLTQHGDMSRAEAAEYIFSEVRDGMAEAESIK